MKSSVITGTRKLEVLFWKRLTHYQDYLKGNWSHTTTQITNQIELLSSNTTI